MIPSLSTMLESGEVTVYILTSHFITQECPSMFSMEELNFGEIVGVWGFRFQFAGEVSCNVLGPCDSICLFHGVYSQCLQTCGQVIQHHAQTVSICLFCHQMAHIV